MTKAQTKKIERIAFQLEALQRQVDTHTADKLQQAKDKVLEVLRGW